MCFFWGPGPRKRQNKPENNLQFHNIYLEVIYHFENSAKLGIAPSCALTAVYPVADSMSLHARLPPPSQSVAPQGYLPSKLYDLDASKYGEESCPSYMRRTPRRWG